MKKLPNEEVDRVVGVGMNARELEANTRLTEFVQADLNVSPQLPFDAASFDACLNVVSVDCESAASTWTWHARTLHLTQEPLLGADLNQPETVFQEMHRVLRPGGQAIMSFSNRCFPSKAVKVWLEASDEQRQRIVGACHAPRLEPSEAAACRASPAAHPVAPSRPGQRPTSTAPSTRAGKTSRRSSSRPPQPHRRKARAASRCRCAHSSPVSCRGTRCLSSEPPR